MQGEGGVATRQQHLLLRRNGRRVKKDVKEKCKSESSPEHELLFALTNPYKNDALSMTLIFQCK